MTAYFYIRVSSASQSVQRQLDKAHDLGFTNEQIFIDEGLTGRNTNRPQLQELLSLVSEGDSITCTELSRISRSTKDLLALSETLNSKSVDLVSLKESIDTKTPMGKFFFTICAAFNQLEIDLAAERAREGREAAKRQGKTGGRPRVDSSKLDRAIELAQMPNMSMREVVEASGISRNVIYQEMRKRGISRK